MDKRQLYSLAKDQWIKCEALIYAYDRSFKSKESASNWLKRGSIAAAVLTALSTRLPSYNPDVTLVAALLTAAVATIDRFYAPSTESHKHWESRTELQSIQWSLVRKANDIADAKRDIGADVLDPINDRITKVARTPYHPEASDEDRAYKRFERCPIWDLLLRSADSSRVVDSQDALAPGAANVVGVRRPRVSRGSTP